MRKEHPDPVPPKKTIAEFVRNGEVHRLQNGRRIALGDKITFTKKGVVTKIITTEGSETVEVEIGVIEDFYGRNE